MDGTMRASERKPIGVQFKPIVGVSVTAEPGARVYVNGAQLCNDEALRLAQTIIDAYMWSVTQPLSRPGWEIDNGTGWVGR